MMIDSATGPERRPENGQYHVTVVVPAYNSARTIGPCVESLISQNYPSELYEIIVVDNKSSDNTAAIVQSYPQVRLVFEREIQTAYAARNRGISVAGDCQVIAFTDSDCVADRGWLSKLVQPFDDPRVGVVGGRIQSQLPGADATYVERFLVETRIFEIEFHPSEPKGFPTGNVAYSASILRKVGFFETAMVGGGDVDLAWRVQTYGGYQAVYVSEAVVKHKQHATLLGLVRQSRRNGLNEILLATLFRRHSLPRRTPKAQLRSMRLQVFALVKYCLSFGIRLMRWRRWRSDRMYLASPLLWFVRESANLAGKVDGLIATRFFRHVPFPLRFQETRQNSTHAHSDLS